MLVWSSVSHETLFSENKRRKKENKSQITTFKHVFEEELTSLKKMKDPTVSCQIADSR